MIYISRWRMLLSFLVVAFGVLFIVPNLMTREQAAESLPNWLASSRLNLGLDLRGGSHLLLEVDLQAVMRERMENAVQFVRELMRKERIGYTRLGVSGQTVVFQLTNPGDLPRIRQLIRDNERGMLVEADGGQVTLRYDEATVRERQNQVIEQSIEIVRRRVDEFGTTEPSIQRQGEDRILVQVPGLDNPQRLKNVLGQTARLSFRLVDLGIGVQEARATGRIPPGSEILPASDERDASGRPAEYLVQRRIIVGGDNLVDAQPSFQNGQPVVSFRFDSVGARRFGDVTRDNVGRPFAIVLDDKVISAPVIREPILGGSGIISGNFTTESARDLALLLRAGALPAPLRVLEERTVGPDLGADSIRAGEIACIIGYLLIAVLMIVRYRALGVIANVALATNLLLTVSIMSLLNATLTLPGIAGMVLGLAMAVDANVLIYERIREETRAGRSALPAADFGFQKAFTTILDSNLTTLIAALFLFFFGSGPVRGFAVTLSIGILCSMFTAVMLTRVMLGLWLRWRRPATLLT